MHTRRDSHANYDLPVGKTLQNDKSLLMSEIIWLYK